MLDKCCLPHLVGCPAPELNDCSCCRRSFCMNSKRCSPANAAGSQQEALSYKTGPRSQKEFRPQQRSRTRVGLAHCGRVRPDGGVGVGERRNVEHVRSPEVGKDFWGASSRKVECVGDKRSHRS